MAPKVLITGANGYIASVTVSYFLSHGWHVRGTVRSAKSSAGLVSALKSYVDSGELEFAIVPDITLPGAFNAAVSGVDAIVHMASPVSLSFTDPDPVIHTAVQGTQAVLRSAFDHAGPQLEAFVMTSSITAIMYPLETPHIFDETQWNEFAEPTVAELGKETPGPVIYAASKVAAEKALWAFRDEFKPTWSVSAIHPALVQGPPLVLPEKAEQLTETVAPVWNILSGGAIPPEQPAMRVTVVDVRDVARVLEWCASHPREANGERYLVVSGRQSGQAMADILREKYPERRGIIREGKPGTYPKDHQEPRNGVWFDTAKVEKATGQGWIGFQKTVLDTAKAFEKYF